MKTYVCGLTGKKDTLEEKLDKSRLAGIKNIFLTGIAGLAFFTASPLGYAAGADLAWDAPTGGGAVQGYKIYWKASGGRYSDENSMDAGNRTRETVSGLDENKLYYFIVKAYNNAGLSPASNEVVWSYSDTTPPMQVTGVKVF
jgi:hypothetical protein